MNPRLASLHALNGDPTLRDRLLSERRRKKKKKKKKKKKCHIELFRREFLMPVTEQDTIRAIIDARSAAVSNGDVETSMADVDDSVVMFDVVDPLRHIGKAAAIARARRWHASFERPPRLETRDVEVYVGGDVAFSHFLSHVSGSQKAGQKVEMWFRTTLGFERKQGRWRIVHEHGSVPFNPESGQVSLGLSPGTAHSSG